MKYELFFLLFLCSLHFGRIWNSNLLNTVGIWIMTIWMSYFLKFGFQIVRYLNGWFMYNVLCTRSRTIPIPDVAEKYIRKKDATIFLVFKWHLNTGPFGILPFFNHLNTKLVWYSDLLSVFLSQRKKLQIHANPWILVHTGSGRRSSCLKNSA